jgi:hypothetical protein
MSNYVAVPYMLNSGYLADVPMTIAAIDPCMSCTDRAMVCDTKTGKVQVYAWEDLRKHGIEHYKRKGVDFSKL